MQTCQSCWERNPDRARLCMMCGRPLRTASVGETRKVVTILFADVKGSTAIGERLDPEAVRRVLSTFYASARDSLERHGGTVEKFIGDAVMAVFGVPRVHEDDAARGVRAAWALLDVMAALNAELAERYGAELQLRIGLNTGEVVAGDPASGSSFVAGDAVNVAARLEQAAEPGTVNLGAETYDLARRIAEVEPVEALSLKGKSEPVTAFRLVSLRTPDEAGAVDVPFVGRETELGALDPVLERVAKTPHAHTVALLGPAGIGKTRLAGELERRSIGRARTARCRCAPEGERAAIAPIQDLLASALGLGTGATVDEVEAETRALVGVGERADLVVVTLRRLILEGDTGEGAWLLGEVLGAVSQRDPLVVAVDDAHHASPSIRTVFADARRRLSDTPVLWLEIARTDAAEPHTTPTGADVITLGPLDASESRRLLAHAAPDLGREAATTILEAAEGNPLFLLETARLVRERPDAAGQLPSGVRALLAARVDALTDEERHALELVATVGRTAPASLVEELVGPGEMGALERLAAIGLVTYSADAVAFAYGSLREVVYAGTTKQRRADQHEAIAELAERDGSPLEVFAHHLERAAKLRAELGAPDDYDRRLSGRAATALGRAGVQTLARGDREAAVEILPRASSLVAVAHSDDGAKRAVGDLAFRLGAWDDVISMLEPIEASAWTWNPLGVALVKRSADGDLDRGRTLLQRAASNGDVDAASALAGSWKGVDEQQAYERYVSALELDPTNPYALGNILEYEIEETGDLAAVAERRPALASALLRRRGQALAGEDRPWSFFDIARFELFLGEDEECLGSFAAAVATSSAAFMVETTIRSLERVRTACEAMPGYRWALELLRLGMRSRFGESPRADSRPTWILVGGSSGDVEGRIGAYRDAAVAALEAAEGVLISGGTAQGVSALAADVSTAVPGVRSVGYLPGALPVDVRADERYDDLRWTDGSTFGPSEPLAYWRDMMDEDVTPSNVRVIGIGGGRLTALELRIALALGARVGVLAGSDGTSAGLLGDPTWGTSGRLVTLDPTAESLRAFLLDR